MKTPAIQLQFPTKPEADAALQTLDLVQRALNVENDLYIREPLRLTVAPNPDGEWHTVSTWFGARPAINPAEPMRHAISPGRPTMLTYAVVLGHDHLMIDLETYGTRPGCQVRSLGAVFFSPGGPQERFYVNFAIAPQAEHGLSADPDTIAWWGRQDPALQAVFEQDQQHPAMALENFRLWIAANTNWRTMRLWGNGASFDEPILAALCHAFNSAPLWKYKHSRCFRTLRALSGVAAPAEPVRPHHALDDAVAQAQHAVAILNHTGGWATA